MVFLYVFGSLVIGYLTAMWMSASNDFEVTKEVIAIGVVAAILAPLTCLIFVMWCFRTTYLLLRKLFSYASLPEPPKHVNCRCWVPTQIEMKENEEKETD